MIDTVTKNYDMDNTFCSYQVTYVGTTKQKSVPLYEENTDYIAIQEWIATGGIVIDNPPSSTETDGGTVIDNGGSE